MADAARPGSVPLRGSGSISSSAPRSYPLSLLGRRPAAFQMRGGSRRSPSMESRLIASGALIDDEPSGPRKDIGGRRATGVETQLKEGYDPRLIVEQLAVRRAQRLRGPGPLPAGSAEPAG